MGTTNPTRTKRFKALLTTLDGNEAAAIAAWNGINPDNLIPVPEVEVPEVQALIDAGFSKEEAEKALAIALNPAQTMATLAGREPLTSKEKSDTLVAQAGLIHVRGRIYVSADLIESAVRVRKTGKPELVTQSGDHRVKAVAAYRLDDGETVVLQNVGEQR